MVGVTCSYEGCLLAWLASGLDYTRAQTSCRRQHGAAYYNTYHAAMHVLAGYTPGMSRARYGYMRSVPTPCTSTVQEQHRLLSKSENALREPRRHL